MSRLNIVKPNDATGKSADLLNGVQKKLGMTPNLMRAFANSSAVLEAYLGFSAALAGGELSPKLREQIALVVAETNGCEYCLAAHSAIGKTLGLSSEELLDSRTGRSTDAKTEIALRFARSIVEERGWVSDEDIEQVRNAGYSDGEISEIVANVAYNLFSNYFNHVAQTPVDFPAVESVVAAVN